MDQGMQRPLETAEDTALLRYLETPAQDSSSAHLILCYVLLEMKKRTLF